MEFDQLIEYNFKNIYLKKSYIKYGGGTIPITYSKTSKLVKSLDQQSKVLYSLFLLYVQVQGYQNILKLRCSFLKKQKEV